MIFKKRAFRSLFVILNVLLLFLDFVYIFATEMVCFVLQKKLIEF